MNAIVLIAALLQVPAPSPDSVETLRENARRAEAEFERLARRLAPIKFSSMNGTQCDEIVGRFCLRYDSGEMPEPPPEPPRVTTARQMAIEALRHAFTYHADQFETSGPLVRYLVEDDRAREAVSAARTFDMLSGDTIWGPLLLGFALHAATEDTAAERQYALALDRLPAEERREIENVEWLLSGSDRSLYGDVEGIERERYQAALWTFADPLYLTPGNERRNQHIARHVWSRALERAPVVGGMVRWGRDLEELTVRYGIPSGRTRSPGTAWRQGSLVEHFDPDQLAYVPEDLLTDGPPPTPPPGETWTLENPRNRSGFAPATIRRLRPLGHQVTRIPLGESTTLRVDGVAVLDSAAAAADSVLLGFWVVANGDQFIAERRATAIPERDTVRLAFHAPVSPGTYVYSAEAFEPETRLGKRARYSVEIPAPTGRILLSDPLVAAPFGSGALPAGLTDAALRPRASLVLQPGDTIGLYAEARGVGGRGDGRYRVVLSMRRADRASLPARVVSWLGRRLGIGSPDTPPRLAWEATADSEPEIIAVDLPLDTDDSGLYLLALEVTDLATGETAETTRLIRLENDS